MDVISHAAGGIADHLDDFACRAQADQDFAVDRKLLAGFDLVAEFKTRRRPRFVSANQFFLAAANNFAFIEEV